MITLCDEERMLRFNYNFSLLFASNNVGGDLYRYFISMVLWLILTSLLSCENGSR